MQKFRDDFPGSYETFEACREMASSAQVENTFFVTSPTSVSDDTLHITRSLPAALELCGVGPERRISVAFNWSVGDESGAGTIRYHRQNNSEGRLSAVERMIGDLIARHISDRLFLQIPRLES
jgi:hypothetical protein